MIIIPPSSSDIALVPGVEIRNNTICINITKIGDDAYINISNNFTLVSFLDDKFYFKLESPNGPLSNISLDEPADVEIEKSDYEFEFNYSTYEDNYNEINFRYSYNIYIQGFDGLQIERYIKGHNTFYELWRAYFAYIRDYKLIINSNVNISADNGHEIKNGTQVNFSFYNDYYEYDSDYYFYGDYHNLIIKWSENNYFRKIIETMNCNITEEHLADIPNLIVQESVDIKISHFNNDLIYTLQGKFILEKEIISKYNPVALWFPENGSIARANFTYSQKGHFYNHTSCVDCKIEPSLRFDQKGFYIKIPELEEEWEPLASDPVLNVTINGTLENNWFDFVIVTIPKEDSWINISIPSLYEISKINSMFEYYDYKNVSKYSNQISFHGKCQDYGKLHIEWNTLPDKDNDLIPDIKDDFPNNPSEWSDQDGDGVGDNSDPDIDGDGYINSEDDFPYDPDEWNDWDDDGTGDNADIDDDNDGVNDTEDSFPTDPDEWNDTDKDGYGDNFDAFPEEISQWSDTDGDGYGDNVSGINPDMFPNDPTKWNDTDKDGIEDEMDEDIDGDGVNNMQDEYPSNPTKWTGTIEDPSGDNIEDQEPGNSENDGYSNLIDNDPGDSNNIENENLNIDLIFFITICIIIIIILVGLIYSNSKELFLLRKKRNSK